MAEKFFKLVVLPSGILKHSKIVMPFSSIESPLYQTARKYHKNVVAFNGDFDFWKRVKDYEDAAVVDNPPFSMSAKIEQKYFDDDVPFLLFRSAVSYPKFIYNKERAGVIYENSRKGTIFSWGIGRYISRDQYIKENYPNLIDNLKAVGALEKYVPVGFSFYLTNYAFKVNTVTFSELIYPKKKDIFCYLCHGVFDESTKIQVKAEDGRLHLMSL